MEPTSPQCPPASPPWAMMMSTPASACLRACEGEPHNAATLRPESWMCLIMSAGGGAKRVGDHRHLGVLQRRVDLWGGRRLGPTEQLQTVLVGVLDRDTMIGEDLAGEVQMLLRDHRPQRLGELIRRQLGVHALVLVRDHYVDPVGVVADVFIDPVELDLQLLRREPNCSEHTKTTSFADGDHHIAAVSEGKNRKLDTELVANGSVHACSWNASGRK